MKTAIGRILEGSTGERPAFESRYGKDFVFSTSSILATGSSSLLSNGYRGQSGQGVKLTPTTSAEVHTSTPSTCIHDEVLKEPIYVYFSNLKETLPISTAVEGV